MTEFLSVVSSGTVREDCETVNLKSLFLTVVIALSVGFLLLWIYVKIQETYAIFHPQTLSERQLPELGSGFEAVTFEGEAGQLSGIWYSGKPSEPLVVFFHGNAGHAFHRLNWMASVIPENWNGFMFDYRGYGLSDGQPSEQGLYQDAGTALQYARDRLDHDRIIYHARSLGVPVAAHTMTRFCPNGIVFESGFPSAASMAKSILPLPGISTLLSVEFNTLSFVNQLPEPCQSVPKFAIHGRDDRVVPLALGQQLYRELPDPKQSRFFRGVGHNDVVESDTAYLSAVQQFYRDAAERDSENSQR